MASASVIAQSDGQGPRDRTEKDSQPDQGNSPPNDENTSARAREIERVSSVRRIGCDNGGPHRIELLPKNGPRTLDGASNNPEDVSANVTGTPLFRWLESDDSDGIAALSGTERPNPREISNAVLAQDTDRTNALGGTDYLWQWGQFVNHDIELTDGAESADAVERSMMGPTFSAIIVSQFAALREGDRFWCPRIFNGRELRAMENTRLSDVIRGDSNISRELADLVFLLPQVHPARR